VINIWDGRVDLSDTLHFSIRPGRNPSNIPPLCGIIQILNAYAQKLNCG